MPAKNTPIPSSVSNKVFPPGKGVEDLEKAIRRVATMQLWTVPEALPTTRELGERYRISNASVCRLLQRLDEEDIVWRRDNGRYYLNDARRLYEKLKPYACLLRKLQAWSRIYQGIMSGFSGAFTDDKAALLFIHNDTLVRHPDTSQPPVHATVEEQRKALEQFFRDHTNQFDGILLDDVWSDTVLEEFEPQLTNAVIVCRPTRIKGVASVAPDFDASAVLALGHLFARGYEEVWLAIPFTTSAPIDLMAGAVQRVATQLGSPLARENVVSAASPEERSKLVARLQDTRRRVGIFCLEDNISLLLYRDFKRAGLTCPERVGLLSGMGTGIVHDHGISSIQVDYDKIGLTAGTLLLDKEHRVVTLPTTLVTGVSS